MVRKQGGGNLAPVELNYNHPDMATLKDFSELYRLKNEKKNVITCIMQKLQAVISDQLKDIQNKTLVKNQMDNFRLVIQQLSFSQTEKEVEEKYIAFMRGIKEKGTCLDPKALEANLLKLEVAYLRRKLQCSERQQASKANHCNSCFSNSGRKRSALKERSNYELTQKCKEQCSQKNNPFTFHSVCSKGVTPFQCQQDSKKSLLVPYLSLTDDEASV